MLPAPPLGHSQSQSQSQALAQALGMLPAEACGVIRPGDELIGIGNHALQGTSPHPTEANQTKCLHMSRPDLLNLTSLYHPMLLGASLSTVIDTIRDVVAEQGAQGLGVTLTLLSTHPHTHHTSMPPPPPPRDAPGGNNVLAFTGPGLGPAHAQGHGLGLGGSNNNHHHLHHTAAAAAATAAASIGVPTATASTAGHNHNQQAILLLGHDRWVCYETLHTPFFFNTTLLNTLGFHSQPPLG